MPHLANSDERPPLLERSALLEVFSQQIQRQVVPILIPRARAAARLALRPGRY